MPPERTNYIKEAFRRQENLIAMAGLGVAGVAFNAGFILLGGALEIAYLWMLSTNARFKRVVDSEKMQAIQKFDATEKDRLLASLPKADRLRYLELAGVRQRVYDSWQTRDSVTQSLLQPSVEKLDYLLDTYLRTQVALNNMREHLGSSDRPFLEKQAQMIETDLGRSNIPDKVKDAKSKNLELLKSRIEKLRKLQEDLEVVRTQLDTLENAIRFVSDQSVSLSDPTQIKDQIDRAVVDVADTERSIQDVERFLEDPDSINRKAEAAARQAAQEKQG